MYQPQLNQTIQLINVTPQVAAGWLEYNTANARQVSKATVEVYAKDMANGNWSPCNDVICFKDGVLINGQHRLHAVILSGVACQFFVSFDWQGEVFDAHRRRSLSALLSMKGLSNAQRIASLLTLWDISEGCTVAVQSACVGLSQARVEALYNQYEEAATFAASLTTPVQPSAFHCAYMRMCLAGIDKESIEQFSHDVTLGNGLRGHPARELHRKVTTGLTIRDTRSRISAIVIQAWNNCAKGVTVRQIFIPENGKPIPAPIVATYRGVEGSK